MSAIFRKLFRITLFVLSMPAFAGSVIHHDLKLSVHPASGELQARDTITLPQSMIAREHEFSFLLHAGLHPSIEEPGIVLMRDGGANATVPVERFRLRLTSAQRHFTLRYRGTIAHSLVESDPRYGKAGRTTPGLISTDGVYLAASSYWYPDFGGPLLTFSLEVDLPAGWSAVSQGVERRTDAGSDLSRIRWREHRPQEQILLVAGRYRVYQREAGRNAALVLLHGPDDALATMYLDATVRYIDLYSRLLGPYPYEKFVLIENFWESGYGMPSFTLLGQRVIRLPFIVDSSYPHEILHNWWGNGVYVAAAGGNWSEGLTAYLADHLMQERRGKGAEYRRSVLQKYSDYVSSTRDFPLTEFRGRHGDISQAVGYGKTLMFFHMLRLHLGDATFIEGLRRFYDANRFRRVSYAEIQHALEVASGLDLGSEFTQWLQRTGAPRLRIDKLRVRRYGGDYRVVGVLEQVQTGPTYVLRIPVVIHLKAHDQPFETTIVMSERRAELSFAVPARPWLLEVDPAFDVFRRLERNEMPPSLGQLFASERMLIIVAADEPSATRTQYRDLAQRWARAGAGIQWRWDNALESLPSDRSIWLFGWANRFRSQFVAALAAQQLSFRYNGARIGEWDVERPREAVVVAARHPKNDAHTLAWLACDDPMAFAGLARKLPHYGKYSYLVFEGNAPRNVLKGQWPVLDSPLKVLLDQRSGATLIPPPHRSRPPLSAILD
ncbi:MAG: M1 family metallopeptidase [Acidiferrobacterales bacterium]